MVNMDRLSISNVCDGYLRERTVKKSCTYGEYGSYEHLLFLFFFVLCLFLLPLFVCFKQCNLIVSFCFAAREAAKDAAAKSKGKS